MCAAAAAGASMYSAATTGQEFTGVEERLVDEVMGRGVFATRAFKEGEVILEETPLVSCQFLYNKQLGYTACHHCLKPLEGAESNVRRLLQDRSIALPYPQCADQPPSAVGCPHCQEQYCSELCRSTAWRHYHRTLCAPPHQPQHPIALLQQEWREHHYPPESLSVMLVARLLSGVLQSEDAEHANASLSLFCHATQHLQQRASHKLLGDHFADHITTLRHCMERALGAPQIQQWLTPEGFQSLLALVGSNGQGVGSSPLARWVDKCDELSLDTKHRDTLDAFIDNIYQDMDDIVGGFLNTEGSGLYKLQSRINHNCRPNASISFPHNSHRLALTAASDILAGQQICISYLDECALSRSRHSRHAILRENYVFVCGCERCEEEQREQQDATSDEESEDEAADQHQ